MTKTREPAGNKEVFDIGAVEVCTLDLVDPVVGPVHLARRDIERDASWIGESGGDQTLDAGAVEVRTPDPTSDYLLGEVKLAGGRCLDADTIESRGRVLVVVLCGYPPYRASPIGDANLVNPAIPFLTCDDVRAISNV